MAAPRRTDIDEARPQIEVWLRDEHLPRAEVARRLGCKLETLSRRLNEWDLSHLKNPGGKGHRIPWNKRSLDAYLVKDGPRIQSRRLKKMLWDADLKPKHCEQPGCGWEVYALDGRLPLELEHTNGDHYDNRIENLEILCPNCHSLRPTSSGWMNQPKYKRA